MQLCSKYSVLACIRNPPKKSCHIFCHLEKKVVSDLNTGGGQRDVAKTITLMCLKIERNSGSQFWLVPKQAFPIPLLH